MRNIKLTIEYDGTDYAGWQTQNAQQKSIQSEIEKAIEKITHEKVKLIGSGRTDAGVHAIGQAANFKTNSKIPCQNLINAVNSKLPDDIVIKDIKEVSLDFHSRFGAKQKTYRYTIFNSKIRPVLQKDFVLHIPYKLDTDLLMREAKALVGRHDFKAFQAGDKKRRPSSRHIKDINIIKEGNFIYIDVTADGFLYNMVRNIIGTLLDVARGKLPQGSTQKILKSKNRSLAGPCAPARGLCLIKVKY